MKYKELLERYKNGLVSEEEKLSIEQDIEKYEAIEEYLSEIMDDELVDLTELPNIEKNTYETLKLKKSVNKRLRKVVFASVATVIALLFLVFFIISPFVDSLYYNPSGLSVGKDEDIDFDMNVITELNMPGYTAGGVFVERHGFGTYEINYSYRSIFTDEHYRVNSIIKRGEIYSIQKDSYENNSVFLDVQIPNREQKFIDRHKERVLNHIKQLNPVSYVSAGITFKKDLTMEELFNLEFKYPDIEFIWAGIRTDSPDNETMDLIGIQLLSSNGVNLDDGVEEKYRAFSILKWLVNPVGSGNSSLPLEVQAYELHYKSLLQYVIDREEAVNVIERRPWKYEFYQLAQKYAEEHGVKTYGVLVYAEAKNLIELVENEEIKLVEFNQAMVSRRNIQ